MPTEFKFKPDRPSSLAAEALLLRALHVYRVARERAKDHAQDLSSHAAALLAGPDVPSYDQLSRRYDGLLDECVIERLESPHAAHSYMELILQIIMELILQIIADETTTQYREEGGIASS
jgi:hypothetical protein